MFATATPRSVEAPSLLALDRVSKIACTVDDRQVVKEAGSFGDSTLARFFPLVEEDETLLKVLEVDAEVTEYLRSTYKVDWDPAKPFGTKGPHPLGPTTRSSTRRIASATATTSAVNTAPAVTPAVAPSPPVRRTPTNAALKPVSFCRVWGKTSP